MSKTVIAPFTDDELGIKKRRAAAEEAASDDDDDHEDSDSEQSGSDSDEGDAGSESSDASDQDDDDDDDDSGDDNQEPVPEEAPKTKAAAPAPKKGSTAGRKQQPQNDRTQAIRSKTYEQADIDRDYTVLYDHKPTPKEVDQQKKLCTEHEKFSDFVTVALDFERDCRVIKNNETGAVVYVTRLCTKKENGRSKKAGTNWRDLTPSMLNQMAGVKAWVKANLPALKSTEPSPTLTRLFSNYSAPSLLIESHRSRPARATPRAAPATKAGGKTANRRKRAQPRAKTDAEVKPLAQSVGAILAQPAPVARTDIKTLAELVRQKMPTPDQCVTTAQFFVRTAVSRVADEQKWDTARILAICGAKEELVGAMDVPCESFSKQQQRLMKLCAEGAAIPGFTMQYCMATNSALARVLLTEFSERQDALADENLLLRTSLLALSHTETLAAEEIQALKADAQSKEAGAKATIADLVAENVKCETKIKNLSKELAEANASAKKMLDDAERRVAGKAGTPPSAEPAQHKHVAVPLPETPGVATVPWISPKTGNKSKPDSSAKASNGTKRPSPFGGKSPKSLRPTEPAAAPAVDDTPAALASDLFD